MNVAKKARSLAVLGGLIVVSCAGCSKTTDSKEYKTTTLPGTAAWSVASNHLGPKGPKVDFWWEIVSLTEKYLVPQNGASAAVVDRGDFDRIDSAFLTSAKLSSNKISGDILKPGCVLVFKTSDGKSGKLQVIGYKALHDLSFPEAADLPEQTKTFILSQPDVPLYHLQVKWTLF
jgi:hypothetical protein